MKKTLSRLPRVVRLAVLSAVLLALCSKSSPLYAFNDWMDANIFFTMGRSMLGGRVLYRDVFDHKGPVLYLLYGLAGLVGGTDFRGVLVLEIIAMTSFLYTGLRTAELLAGRRLSVWWMALPAAGMAASRAFSHGGSAEELLLPLLAAALFSALPAAGMAASRAFSHGGSAEELLLPLLAAALFSLVRALHSPTDKPLCAVCVQGLLAGCALWLKYTVLGFYLAWVVVLAALYLRRGWLTQLGRSVGAYLGGMALATLPWVVYFGVHGALGDWFTAYFYDNLFLYKGEGGGLPALAQHLWWAVRDGLPAALLLAAFLLWALLTRRFAAAGGVAALAAGLAATSLMGGYLVYYGLVLAVFAPLGLVPLVRLAEKTPAPVRTALPWAVLAACAAACYALTPNRALRGRARADLPQYRFAAQINGGSLLNYGTLDGGFYTAAGVLPPCKYFCVTNMPLDDQWTDQQAVLKAGAVDYVVALTGDLHGDFPQYAVIDRCSYDGGEGEVTWYLYQLQR